MGNKIVSHSVNETKVVELRNILAEQNFDAFINLKLILNCCGYLNRLLNYWPNRCLPMVF